MAPARESEARSSRRPLVGPRVHQTRAGVAKLAELTGSGTRNIRLCAFVRLCVPCVPSVSRLPPVSFYRYRYRTDTCPACVPCVNVNTTDATVGATALLLPAQNTHTLHDPKRGTEHTDIRGKYLPRFLRFLPRVVDGLLGSDGGAL